MEIQLRLRLAYSAIGRQVLGDFVDIMYLHASGRTVPVWSWLSEAWADLLKYCAFIGLDIRRQFEAVLLAVKDPRT